MTRRLILLLLLLSASLAQAQRHYRVTNLGVLPGNTATVGYGLNDHGDVVGYCATGIQYTSDFREYPFVYRWAKISNFAPNGFYDYRTGVATGINNSGIICGYFYQPRQVPKPNIPYVDLAFVYDGNFKPLTDGHHSSFANAINNSGVVVGEYTPLDETLST